ncbi:MAG: hypothetical protein LBR60_08290 [Fibrobacter sp.]|jgi:hypothetical protein|nr:hypothetical protein [Fibrobacter sp.]
MNKKETITEEISKNLKKHGFHPIPVQTLAEAETSRYFGGSFDEFVEAAKALGAKGIFIETLYLEDDEFFYDSCSEEDDECCCGCQCGCCDCDDDYDDDGEEGECTCEKDDDGIAACSCQAGGSAESGDEESGDEESEEDAVWLDPEDLDGVDLALIRPEIEKFAERVGEECGVRLTIPGVDHVEVEIFTDWYDQFAALVDEASEMIELNTADALKEIQKNHPDEN